MSTHSGPHVAASPPPSPGAWPCLTSQYYSGHNAALENWPASSSFRSSTDCAPLPLSFSLYGPKFVLWPFLPSILSSQHSIHSELCPSLCFSLPVLSPWSEWGNRGVQWGNAVWIIQPWHFGARLVFPGQPVLCVCYYLMVPDAMIHYSFLWKGTMGRSWQLTHTKTFSSSNCPQYPTPCYTHHHTPNYQPKFIEIWLRFRLDHFEKN